MDALAPLGNALAAVLEGGNNTLLPVAEVMAYAFACLGAAWVALSVATGARPTGMATKLIILAVAYLMVIQSSQEIGEKLITGAVDFGLMAGGSSMNPDTFLNSPDSIFAVGYARVVELWTLAEESCGPTYLGGCLAHMGTYFPLTLAGWILFGAFGLIAIAVVLTFAMLKFTILAGVVILPAAIFAPSAAFAGGIIKYAVHAAVQIMVLAMVVSVSNMVIGHIIVHAGPPAASAPSVIVASFGLIALTLMSMALAGGITHGAMTSMGSFLAPVAMGAAAGRSAAGHLDAPATSAAKAAGGATFKALSSAANASQASIAGMRRGSMAVNPNRRGN